MHNTSNYICASYEYQRLRNACAAVGAAMALAPGTRPPAGAATSRSTMATGD